MRSEHHRDITEKEEKPFTLTESMLIHPNLEALFLLIPGRSCVQFPAEPLHGCNNGFSLVGPGMSCLACVNDGRIQQKTHYRLSICFNNKYTTPIIALSFSNGIIVNKIAGAIQDWFLLVELYPSNYMARMTKNNICTCINKSVSKGNLFRWRNVSPIWSPMSRDDQKIDALFCLAHQFQKFYSSLILQFNRTIKYSWLCFGCFPVGLIIRKGDQPQLPPFHFPDGRFRGLGEGRACTSMMNASILQITDGLKEPFVFKIKRMVIRK